MPASGGSTERPAGPGVRLVVLVTTLVQTLVTMSAVVPAAIAPDLAPDLGVPTAFIGYQIAVVYGAAMLTSIIGGTAVRRLGACRVSQTALALCAAGLVVASLGWAVALIAGSVLIGFGYGLTNPASSHLLERWTPPRYRNLVFSIKQTGVPLGGIAAGLVAPPLTVGVGWPLAFAVTAIAAAAILAGLQAFRSDWDSDRDPGVRLIRSPFGDLRLVWRTPILRHLSLAALCFAAAQLCLTTFLVALLVEDLAFTLVVAGAVLSAVQAAGFAGRVFWGWLADRLGDGLAVLAGMTAITIAGAAVTAFIGAETPRSVAVGVLLVFGFAAIGWNGVYLAEVARAAVPGRTGSATGGSLVFTFGGVLAGPPAFTLAFGATGSFAATFGLLAVVPFAGLGFVLLARRGRRPRPPLPRARAAGTIRRTRRSCGPAPGPDSRV